MAQQNSVFGAVLLNQESSNKMSVSSFNDSYKQG